MKRASHVGRDLGRYGNYSDLPMRVQSDPTRRKLSNCLSLRVSGRASGERLGEGPHLATKIVELVEKGENDRQRGLVDPELVAQFQDEANPRDVYVQKPIFAIPPIRAHPILRNPVFEHGPFKRRT